MCGSRRERRGLVARLAAGDDGRRAASISSALHAAVDDDALDAGLLQRAASARPSSRRLADRDVADDEVVADDADRRPMACAGERSASVSSSEVDAACDERMTRRIELRAANRRGQSSRRSSASRARSVAFTWSSWSRGRSAVPTWAFAALRARRAIPWRWLRREPQWRRPTRCVSGPTLRHGGARRS